jgi:hypothetical protein
MTNGVMTPLFSILEWFGEMGIFCAQLFRATVTPPYESRELLRQMDEIKTKGMGEDAQADSKRADRVEILVYPEAAERRLGRNR